MGRWSALLTGHRDPLKAPEHKDTHEVREAVNELRQARDNVASVVDRFSATRLSLDQMIAGMRGDNNNSVHGR